MASSKFYFRCKSNPDAAPLVLESFWEAREMKNHPDYERIDAMGEVIPDEEDSADNQIPIQIAGLGKRAAAA